MKVILLGGSGFLGSHVADVFLQRGDDVTIYDQSAYDQSAYEQSVPSQAGVSFIEGDLRDEALLAKSIKGADYAYNFAGVSDLDFAQSNPRETIMQNVLANEYVMAACVKHKVKRYIYASSVYVFSQHGGFYRCSKQAAEAYIEEYYKTYGLNYTIMRFGSLYGPRSDPRNGLYRIIESALKNKKVSYQGDADAVREYIHVRDAANSCVKMLEQAFENQHVVLTGNEPMKVYDVLCMLSEMLGYGDDVECLNQNVLGHYSRTPYSYLPKIGNKYLPPVHVDFGQGMLELLQEVESRLKAG